MSVHRVPSHEWWNQASPFRYTAVPVGTINDAIPPPSLSTCWWKQPFWQNLFCLTTTSLVVFVLNQLMTIVVCFFPQYASDVLQASDLQISAVFSLFPCGIMLASPVASKACTSPLVGRQLVISTGLSLSCFATLAFAYFTSIQWLLVLRLIQGLGAGWAIVGCVSTLAELYHDQLLRVIGGEELVVATAFITSPGIGSVLYDMGSVELVFITSAALQGLLLLLIPLLFMEFNLPDVYTKHTDMKPMSVVGFKHVCNRTTLTCLAITTLAMCSFGFIDPTLGSHFQTTMGAQHTWIGLGFAVSPGMYWICSRVQQHPWVRRECRCRSLISVGLVLLSVGFLLFGPIPLVRKFEPYLIDKFLPKLQWLSLLMIGSGGALSIAPSVSLAVMNLKKMVPEHRDFMHGMHVLIGLFSGAVYLGQMIGPFVAWFFMDILPSTRSPTCVTGIPIMTCENSLPWASTAFSMLLLGSFIVMRLTLPQDVCDTIEEGEKNEPCSGAFFQRQALDYGQFVYFEEESASEEE